MAADAAMLAQGYYVYEHWRPDTDLCFYVGAGKGLRAGNMKARNKAHLAIQAELARQGMCVEVKLVRGQLTQDEAHTLEIERIAMWRGMGVSLANQGDGGPGAAGLKHSAESRARRSEAMMGNTRGKGVPRGPRSDETRAKISAAQLGKKQSEETKQKRADANRGQKRSAEARQKMSEAARRIEQRKKDQA